MQAQCANFIGSCQYHLLNKSSQAAHTLQNWSVAFLATGVEVSEGAIRTVKWSSAVITLTMNVAKDTFDAYGYTAPVTVLLQNVRPFITIGDIFFDLEKRILPWAKGEIPKTWSGFVALICVTSYRVIGLVQFMQKIEIIDLTKVFAAMGKLPVLGTIVLLPVKLVMDVINVIGLVGHCLELGYEIKEKGAAINARIEVLKKIHRMWQLQEELLDRVQCEAYTPNEIGQEYETLRHELEQYVNMIHANHEHTIENRVGTVLNPLTLNNIIAAGLTDDELRARLDQVAGGVAVGNAVARFDGVNPIRGAIQQRVSAELRNDIARASHNPLAGEFNFAVARQNIPQANQAHARVVYDLMFRNEIDGRSIDNQQITDGLDTLVHKTASRDVINNGAAVREIGVWEQWDRDIRDPRITSDEDLDTMKKVLSFETRKYEVMIANAQGEKWRPMFHIASDVMIIFAVALDYAKPAIATFFGVSLVATSMPILLLGVTITTFGMGKVMSTKFGGKVPTISREDLAGRQFAANHALLVPPVRPPVPAQQDPANRV